MVEKEDPNVILSTLERYLERKKLPMKDIKIINDLLYHVPCTATIRFYAVYLQDSFDKLVSSYATFSRLPSTKNSIQEMKQLIARREAKPLGTVVYKHKYPSNRPIFGPKQKPRQHYGGIGGDILPVCESEYKRAPWMYAFTVYPINGMALNRFNPKFSNFVTDELVKVTPDGEYYKANSNWYRYCCSEKRPFVPNGVAYITHSNESIREKPGYHLAGYRIDRSGVAIPEYEVVRQTRQKQKINYVIHIETKEMYDASIKRVDIIRNVESAKPNEMSISVAEDMLHENERIRRGGYDVVEIVMSFDKTSNYTLARDLSKVLVYLQPIIKNPQIHARRVEMGQYWPHELVKLSKRRTLPEVFINPEVTQDQLAHVFTVIKYKRRMIEDDFYEQWMSSTREGTLKIHSTRRSTAVVKRADIKLPTCPNNRTDRDIVYYKEGNKLYCFDRSFVIDRKVNPVTGNPFSAEFLLEIEDIYDPIKSGREEELAGQMIQIVEVGPETELAPGLFEKLKDDIVALTPLYCSECNEEIFLPKYKSVSGSEKVIFCSKACFEKYKFE